MSGHKHTCQYLEREELALISIFNFRLGCRGRGRAGIAHGKYHEIAKNENPSCEK